MLMYVFYPQSFSSSSSSPPPFFSLFSFLFSEQVVQAILEGEDADDAQLLMLFSTLFKQLEEACKCS